MNWLKKYKRSASDNILGGVCGGLGQTTEIPSWLWRVIFLLIILTTGVGVIPYSSSGYSHPSQKIKI